VSGERPYIRKRSEVFWLYESELRKVNHQAHRIFNVDRTGITTVQHRHSKAISMRRKKEVASLTSAERVNLITVVTGMNATGTYVPLLIVFPRKTSKRTPSIFKDESTGSCICLRSPIYMSHVNKIQPIRVKMIRIAGIRAYVTRMKDNVSRSFEMRHVIHDIRISSGQWPQCDVTYGVVRCPRSYEISPG
jgi:hypothetical protein